MTIERWLSRWLPYENLHLNRNKPVSNRHEGGSNRMEPTYLKYQCRVRLVTSIQSLTLYRTQCSVTSLKLSEPRFQCQLKLQWVLSWLKTMALRHRMNKKQHFPSNATRQMDVVMKIRYCHRASWSCCLSSGLAGLTHVAPSLTRNPLNRTNIKTSHWIEHRQDSMRHSWKDSNCMRT